ncbi:UNVERIFIED_CONTAM: hypothetical protein GTU68_018568 [Idotea baltica]|nr:hypothetical protein [Idotea baltica]
MLRLNRSIPVDPSKTAWLLLWFWTPNKRVCRTQGIQFANVHRAMSALHCLWLRQHGAINLSRSCPTPIQLNAGN